jgi:hypothetical protein
LSDGTFRRESVLTLGILVPPCPVVGLDLERLGRTVVCLDKVQKGIGGGIGDGKVFGRVGLEVPLEVGKLRGRCIRLEPRPNPRNLSGVSRGQDLFGKFALVRRIRLMQGAVGKVITADAIHILFLSFYFFSFFRNARKKTIPSTRHT